MLRFRSRAGSLPVLVLLGASLGASAARAADAGSRPLPDARTFLESVRDRLHSDRVLLAEYTFTEKHVETKLDSKGRVKSAKTETYEVYPSDEGQIYRRLVARDGRPLDAKELAEEDQKYEARLEKRRQRSGGTDVDAREARDRREQQKEREIVEELFQMDDIQVAGRESVNGRSTVLVTFRPKPGYVPRTQGGKVLQKLAGRAWIDEEDRQLVRIDAELLDPLPVGPGGIFRLQKGARAYFQRRRVNDEIWMPAEARFIGAAKVLFFVVGRLDALSQYSDYRKFTVSTSTDISTDRSSN